MSSLNSFLVIVVLMHSVVTIVISQESCKECNCQFSNILDQVIDQLIEAKVKKAFTGVSGSGSGATYIRWGRTSCPNVNGTKLVYAGRAGGTYHKTRGGAANRLCLPRDPDYLSETVGHAGQSIIRATEYHFAGHLHRRGGHIVPCAVCYVSTRTSVLMIPAKTQCPSSWTREYNGYLVAEHDAFYRSSFECTDRNPESAPGSKPYVGSANFYNVEGYCDGLSCPPYERHRILSCTVCTK